MKQLIIGTAGHVDHGKTTLIQALTGTNTDRLREEQERGMSIELGFAAFTLPGGAEAGIVDVPGHERFLKNMLAGASGIDLVMLVIAADEGVMPQTREHLDILQILRSQSGIVVLTKTDLVEPEWLDMMEEEVRERLVGSLLADAPIVRVSAATGHGIADLAAILDERTRTLVERSAAGPFRLPIDRVFTMPGFGTVVTGTLWSGRIRTGDLVQLQPSGEGSRVRGLQSHGRKRQEVTAGSRVAINLAGIDVDRVRRGDVVCPPGLLKPSYLVDAHADLLADLPEPVANRTRVRLHAGADEVIGRMVLLDREELAPGADAPVQLQLEEPVAVLRGDRFVLRLYSPMRLLGGGTVLDPVARRHRRFDAPLLDRLAVLEAGGFEDQVVQWLNDRALALSTPREIATALGADVSETAEVLSHLCEQGYAVAVGDRYVACGAFDRAESGLAALIEAHHSRYPLRAGLPREEAKSRIAPKLDNRSWNALLETFASRKRIALAPAAVRLSSHEVVYSPAQQSIADALEARFRAAPFDPPPAEEARSEITAAPGDVEAVFESLVDRAALVKICPDLYLHREALDAAVEALGTLGPAGFTAGQVRDLLGSSRKVVIPLLEYLDAQRVTRRVGDARVLEGTRP